MIFGNKIKDWVEGEAEVQVVRNSGKKKNPKALKHLPSQTEKNHFHFEKELSILFIFFLCVCEK